MDLFEDFAVLQADIKPQRLRPRIQGSPECALIDSERDVDLIDHDIVLRIPCSPKNRLQVGNVDRMGGQYLGNAGNQTGTIRADSGDDK